MPARFEAATGPGRLNAVEVTADAATGKATRIERLNLSAQELGGLIHDDVRSLQSTLRRRAAARDER